MASSYQNILVKTVLLITLVSCARAPAHLRTVLQAGKYKEAADLVAGNPALATMLAAMILERAATTDAQRFYALERLSAAGEVGLSSLKLLASEGDETGRAARVALKRYDAPAAQTIAACLADASADVRRMCAYVWHPFLTEDDLKILLVDSDPTVRLYAVRGLAILPVDNRRAGVFVDVLLRDPSLKVRMEAARRGDLLGDEAILLLKDRLSDDRLGMRLAAVAGIATIGTAAARDLLMSVASAPLDEVALSAAAALVESGEPAGKRRILAALRDERPSIRGAALYLLSRANLPNASALTVRSLDDPAPEVVLAAANLLRNDVSSREKIIAALNRISKLKTIETGRARNLLALLGDKQAEKQIAQVLKDPSKLTEAELSAQLNALGGASGLIGAVVPLLGDPRETIRIHSAVLVLFSMSKI